MVWWLLKVVAKWIGCHQEILAVVVVEQHPGRRKSKSRCRENEDEDAASGGGGGSGSRNHNGHVGEKGWGGGGNMNYARPRSAINYAPAPVMQPYPVVNSDVHFFGGEKTRGCSIM
ncbi:hypothetical protein CK203_007064 [Vitis vinifera]|uniref:Uncharacterized protein n=1 Tax=Vitis vinifera TaxID=29760 RepID=A0A438KC35_VITVI|nr:hypothetical protein CK203_007064 [Vitis vinifera]